MRSIHQPLISIAVVLSTSLFFVRCHDQDDQTTGNVSLSTTTDSGNIVSAEDTTLINQGKLIFVKNCGTCHAIWKTDNYLAGVVEKAGVSYLKLYITKQDSLIKAKDKYALKLKRVFGNLANIHNYRCLNS
jgi:hypothetical protein